MGDGLQFGTEGRGELLGVRARLPINVCGDGDRSATIEAPNRRVALDLFDLDNFGQRDSLPARRANWTRPALSRRRRS